MRNNYQQLRKQKELAKKVRQQEKQQRRTARLAPGTSAPDGAASQSDPAAPSGTTGHGGS